MRSYNKDSKKLQSKLMRIIRAPFRVLSKAKKFYIKGLEGCAGRVGNVGYMGGPGGHVSHLPRSFSGNSAKSSRGDEEFREILRAASRRAMEMRRSYSVGIGKIGRIDEEKPCSFEEEDYLVYARSRSCAIRKV